jgi:hypothetical protein
VAGWEQEAVDLGMMQFKGYAVLSVCCPSCMVVHGVCCTQC